MLSVSIFGAYPKLTARREKVWIGVPVDVTIIEASWKGQQFVLAGELHSPVSFSFVLSGGASTGRGLSQNLMAQTEGYRSDLERAGVCQMRLVDFFSDQLCSQLKLGAYRLASGLAGIDWLEGSEVARLASSSPNNALFLGGIMAHPAALLATVTCASPFAGGEYRLPARVHDTLLEALPHFTSPGHLVVETQSASRNREPLVLDGDGWVLTGRRRGLEEMARLKAVEEGRPLIVASRQEAVVPLLPYIGRENVHAGSELGLGTLRTWMLSQLKQPLYEEAAHE